MAHQHIVLKEYHLYNWRNTFNKLYAMQQNGVICDISLKAADDVVRAHKTVLAIRVPYFKHLFTSNLCDNIDKSDLSGFPAQVVEQILKFVYIGKVDVEDLDNLLGVFRLADFLQLASLKSQCEEIIFERLLDLSTCIKIANFTEGFSPVLQDKNRASVREFISSRWLQVIQQEDWTLLNYKFFHALIMCDCFNVRNEEQVLTSVLRWVENNPAQSEKLNLLLHDVRLHAISDIVLDELKTNDFVQNSEGCLKLVDEGRDFKSNNRVALKKRSYFEKSIYAFCYYDTRNVVFNLSYDYSNVDMWIYSKINDRWEVCENKSIWNWAKPAVVGLDGAFYLIGDKQWKYISYAYNQEKLNYRNKGRDADSYNNVLCFDRISYSWREMPSLPYGVRFHAAGEINGNLYICGGRRFPRTGNQVFGSERLVGIDFDINETRTVPVKEYISTMTMYDKSIQCWNVVSEMDIPRINHASISLHDKVYVIGGETSGSDLTPCAYPEVWDSGKNKWSSLEHPAHDRSQHSVTKSDDRIYIFGGFNLNPDILCNEYTWEGYDPREGSWSTPKPLPQKLSHFTVCTLDQEIYLIGGEPHREHMTYSELTTGDTSQTLPTTYVYDIRADKWRSGLSVPSRAAPDLCEVDRELAGLGDTPGFKSAPVFKSVPVPIGTGVFA